MANRANFFFTYLFLLQFPVIGLVAQVDSSRLLPALEVSGSKEKLSAFGKKEEQLSQFELIASEHSDLGEALGKHSNIHIKNYGPALSASSSLRGLGSGHTAIFWNGIAIQNHMLGQSDLSLIPLVVTDELSWQKGGSSVIWGSGAVAGSIFLNSNAKLNKGWQTGLSQDIGSFGLFSSGIKLGFSNDKLAVNTRLYCQNAINNYPHKTISGQSRNLPHAENESKGLLQQIIFKPSSDQQLTLKIWGQESDRNLPPTLFQQSSEARQEDASLKSLLSWQKTGERMVLQTRAHFSGDRLVYEDPVSGIASDSKIYELSAQVQASIPYLKRNQLNIGLQQIRVEVVTDVYNQNSTRNTSSFFVSNRFANRLDNHGLLISLRQDVVDGKFIAPVPSLSYEGKISKGNLMRGNISRNYRLPTFNDLYWPGSGKTDLKPESGWSQELAWNHQKKLEGWKFSFDIGGFNRLLRDYILWLPQGALWSPQNVGQIWSRGIESEFTTASKIKAWDVELNLNYDWIRSSEKSNPGKQLIYVPIHQFGGGINFILKKWRSSYLHQIKGKSFTLSDNSASLEEFHLGTFRLSRNFSEKKFSGLLFIEVSNLWNESYFLVAGRPMPGRHFKTGLRINYQQIKN